MTSAAYTVFLVEDEPCDVLLIGELLGQARQSRFDLIADDRLGSAVPRIAQIRPDVVLLDLNLPDSRGLATVDGYVARAPEIPMVVITAMTDRHVSREAVNRGAQDCMLKGALRPDVLELSLQHAIARSRVTRDLRRSNRVLRMVNECGRTMLRGGDEPDLLCRVCGAIVEQGGYRTAWVGFADAHGRVRPAMFAGEEDRFVAQLARVIGEHGGTHDPYRQSAATGAPVIVGDATAETVPLAWRAEAFSGGFSSMMVLPLKTGGRVFGWLTVHGAAPDAFGTTDAGLLASLADDLSAAVGRWHLGESPDGASHCS